jgi:dihydroxy-acid dehydratase
MRYLLDNKMIDGSCLTCTGKTVAQNLASIKTLPEDNPIIMPLANPIKSSGHLQVNVRVGVSVGLRLKLGSGRQ